MKRWRRTYYDIFSLFYDRIIELHSRDRSAALRDFLLEKSGLSPGQKILDICTGTGAVAIRAAQRLAGSGLVVGLDFSSGMLKRARQKVLAQEVKAYFVLADTAMLPFPDEAFEVVACSHAMYELDPSTRAGTLSEVLRVLVPGGVFIMMEHAEPSNPFIRFLYRLRLATMGSTENMEFARDERPFLRRFFSRVRLEKAPGGKSKVVWGRKSTEARSHKGADKGARQGRRL